MHNKTGNVAVIFKRSMPYVLLHLHMGDWVAADKAFQGCAKYGSLLFFCGFLCWKNGEGHLQALLRVEGGRQRKRRSGGVGCIFERSEPLHRHLGDFRCGEWILDLFCDL